jgi:recombination protein RecT
MTTPATQNGQAVQNKQTTVKDLLSQAGIKKRFEEILGEKAPGFISSVLNVVNGNTLFANCNPNSIIMSAAVAATLDLPINPNLGFAYIIPYGGQAQFQIGYKGFFQLAMRTGQYKKINVAEVRAGQLKSFNLLTEEIEIDFSVEGGEVIGFVGYMKMVNGFEKTVYWNVGKMIAHAKKFSKSYGKTSSPWTTNFNEMATKTLIKYMLSKFGILSIETLSLQNAVKVDQAVINDDNGETVTYVDLTEQAAISSEASQGGEQTNSSETPSATSSSLSIDTIVL